jgi:hypothetical protein
VKLGIVGLQDLGVRGEAAFPKIAD